jgi:hypothetical protein
MNIELAKKVAASQYAAPEQVAAAREFIRQVEGYAAPEDMGPADVVSDAAYEAAKASLRFRSVTMLMAGRAAKALRATL